MKTVELVSNVSLDKPSGIGRYTQEIYNHLKEKIPVEIKSLKKPPLSNRISILGNFPIGVTDHRPGNIVHFTQIMGCAQMLWRPIHPSIVTVHDMGVLVCDEDKLLFSPIDLKILDLHIRGISKNDQIIVHSTRTKNDLVKQLAIPEEKISILPVSVDSEHFRPIRNAAPYVYKKFGINKCDCLDLIFVGSELPRKNLISTLQAIKLLNSRHINVRLLKVGGSGGKKWRTTFLNQINSIGVEKNIIIIDQVSEDDLPWLYNFADAAITSTLLEGGFAWTVMEAMACGKPAIASEAALIPENVGEVVTGINAKDPEDIAMKIETYAKNKNQLNGVAVKARKIIEGFTWDNEASLLIPIYLNLGIRYD